MKQRTGNTRLKKAAMPFIFRGRKMAPVPSTAITAYSSPLAYRRYPTVIYYRVKSSGHKYARCISEILQVKPSPSHCRPAHYSQPGRRSATLAFTAFHEGNIAIRIVSMQGAYPSVMQYAANRVLTMFRLNHLGAFPPGIYMVQLNDGTNDQAGKIIIRH